MAGYKLVRNAQGQRVKKDGTLAKPAGRKPDPTKQKPIRRSRTGLRPHVWLVGPDHYKHSFYTPWQRAYSQAAFRDEEWDLTFEEFFKLWDGKWEKRGRKPDDYCMTRIDPEKAWTRSNVHIVTRYEHLCAVAAARKAAGVTYSTRGPDKKKRKSKGKKNA